MLVFCAFAHCFGATSKNKRKVEQGPKGIDIMIALDISQSMQIEDFQPNRLEAAKQVARGFC